MPQGGEEVFVLFAAIWPKPRRPEASSAMPPENPVLPVAQFPLHKAQMPAPLPPCRPLLNYLVLCGYLTIRDVGAGSAEVWVRARDHSSPVEFCSLTALLGPPDDSSLTLEHKCLEQIQRKKTKLLLPITPGYVLPGTKRLSFPPSVLWTGSLCRCLRVWFAGLFLFVFLIAISTRN